MNFEQYEHKNKRHRTAGTAGMGEKRSISKNTHK